MENLTSEMTFIIGACIGAGASVITMLFSSLISTLSERNRIHKELAMQLALREYDSHVEYSRKTNSKISPVHVYWIFAYSILTKIKLNKSPEEIAKQFNKIAEDANVVDELVKNGAT